MLSVSIKSTEAGMCLLQIDWTCRVHQHGQHVCTILLFLSFWQSPQNNVLRLCLLVVKLPSRSWGDITWRPIPGLILRCQAMLGGGPGPKLPSDRLITRRRLAAGAATAGAFSVAAGVYHYRQSTRNSSREQSGGSALAPNSPNRCVLDLLPDLPCWPSCLTAHQPARESRVSAY